jgi:glyoxylase-like metal-dependent hydrolase (beta-lactamase superfamily II)
MRPTRIVRVLAPNPGPYTLEGTNTWVVGPAPSIVIDPGPDDEGHLNEVVRTAGSIAAILLTHGHPDHAPGAPRLARWSGARIHAFRPPDGGDRVREGRPIPSGGVELVPVPTPGHTRDHVAFWLPPDRALFTGDAVLGRGTSVIDPPEGDLAAYLRSLRRMMELRPASAYPGHGPVVLDAFAKLREYEEHRLERERQIVDALGSDAGTVDDLVASIYSGYAADLRPLAARSVLAHLNKLEAEGVVARPSGSDDGRYRLIGPRRCERCGRPAAGNARLCERCRLAVLQERPES